MDTRIPLKILPQPDDTTCGPTCLQAVYHYYGDTIGLPEVIRQVKQLKGGGTLAVFMGCHALKRGYRAKLYTYDLQVFDPTWFKRGTRQIVQCLQRQMKVKPHPKIHTASRAYLDFLRLGGTIQFEDLTTGLVRGLLKRAIPILTGLSATFLYRTAREIEVDDKLVYDDIQGVPSGHFVVLCGYDMIQRTALVADPLLPNPISGDTQIYSVRLNRLVCAIMLGILTYDANLLVITPAKEKELQRKNRDHSRRH
ncbi:MAG: peptidase-C39 like family protein [Desulfatitalea sp.]|nr:hypothetical protein [Desulfatitalea sp.]NNK00192.1 peptidase-C39 like family protein [Desulfatitalea sp.]